MKFLKIEISVMNNLNLKPIQVVYRLARKL
ncbi:hypothetical protein SAMN00777080_3010 [Aquiflexum balticum DSM 16537]|uniref:Uncharacterized protein n=1 Tax=Aquiflexum balticum DSM 16537 TaxID=758820 RepID=A0A1W2H6B7_9BACT|nr:hypothetical protein SAMN00777080_3010 [Aquiflexum balticum DSM 16537]